MSAPPLDSLGIQPDRSKSQANHDVPWCLGHHHCSHHHICPQDKSRELDETCYPHGAKCFWRVVGREFQEDSPGISQIEKPERCPKAILKFVRNVIHSRSNMCSNSDDHLRDETNGKRMPNATNLCMRKRHTDLVQVCWLHDHQKTGEK